MPTRSCVVCRKTSSKAELIRFVMQKHLDQKERGKKGGKKGGEASVSLPEADRLVIDVLHSLPGRGAYCHASAACLLSKGVFEKICHSLEVGSAKKRKHQFVTNSEQIRVKEISFEDLIEWAKQQSRDNFFGAKSQRATLKLELLENFVGKELDRVRELRQKRRVRL